MSIKFDNPYWLFDYISRVSAIPQDKHEIVGAILNTMAYIPEPKIILEIGSYFGGSLAMLSGISDDAMMISVEPELQYPMDWDMLDEIVGDRVYHVRGLSQDINTYNSVVNLLDGRKIDVLFIDGDHTTVGTWTDYRMYGKLVNSPGVILFHDIADQYELGPSHVFYDLAKTTDHSVLIASHNGLGIGMLYV